MKIKELYEIVEIPDQHHGIIDFTMFDHAKQFKQAKVINYPLLLNQDGLHYYFCIEINNIKVAFIIAEKLTDFVDKETITIQRTYTIPKYQGQGLMTSMYRTIRNQGIRIISDVFLTSKAKSVWRKLIDMVGVDILNRKTGEKRTATVDDLKINDPNILLIFEIQNFETPYLNNNILQEMNVFIKLTDAL